MALSVEITCREMIKPSTLTPSHLRSHKLSFIDQFAPPIYIPLIFFYQSDQIDRLNATELLKNSLSDTLVRYYPLAGRIKPNQGSIDCNDEGVEYLEAKVSNQMSEVIDYPNLDELKALLPFEPYSGIKEIVLGAQVNFFGCGGVAIGVCISHKVGDGTSLVTFMNAWSAIARGDDKSATLHPRFDLGTHFPPRDLNGIYRSSVPIATNKIVTQRSVFTKKNLTMLKEKAKGVNESDERIPTRVEAITAFFVKQVMETLKSQSSSKKVVVAVHALNLRPRMVPPLREESFGNFWWYNAVTFPVHIDLEHHQLATQVSDSFKKINNDYIKTIQNGECLQEIKRGRESAFSDVVELCNFSSWCRFPMYDVDFGWGKPTWVCTTSLPLKNTVVLLSTKDGEGIEAWINKEEEDMTLLEHYQELPSLV